MDDVYDAMPPPADRSARMLARFVAALLAGIFLVQALWPLFEPVGLEASRMRDDAYYQFEVVRQLAAGQGFTVDAVHPASGVQVLWCFVLLPFALVLGAGSLPGVAYFLGLGFLLAAVWQCFRLLQRFVTVEVALGVSLLVLSRPLLVLEAENGQETALALFVLFAWARSLLPSAELPEPRDRRMFVWTMLLPWVRTDLLLFPFGFLIHGMLAKRFGLATRRLSGPGLAFVVSSLCYLVLQKLVFGAWLPVSGFAIPAQLQASFFAGQPALGEVLQQYWWFVRPVLLGGPWALAGTAFGVVAGFIVLTPLANRKRFLPLILVLIAVLFGASDWMHLLIAALGVAALPHIWQRLRTEHASDGVLGLWPGFLFLLILHLPLRWYPRNYYFVVAALPGAIGLAWLLGQIFRKGGLWMLVPAHKKKQLFWLVLLILAAADPLPPAERFPWQKEMRLAADGMEQLFEGETFASFNSGLLSYYTTAPVLNLDGVVDGACLEASRKKELAAWLDAEGVRFVVDSPRQLANKDPDRYAPHASGLLLGPRGSAEYRPLIAFDLRLVRARHPGTDCQMLYLRAGEPEPDLGPAPRILEKDANSVLVLLPLRAGEQRSRFYLARAGRERELRFDPSTEAATYVVTRISQAQGSLRIDGQTALRW